MNETVFSEIYVLENGRHKFPEGWKVADTCFSFNSGGWKVADTVFLVKTSLSATFQPTDLKKQTLLATFHIF